MSRIKVRNTNILFINIFSFKDLVGKNGLLSENKNIAVDAAKVRNTVLVTKIRTPT